MSLDQLNAVKQEQEVRLEQRTSQYHQLRAVLVWLATAHAFLKAIPGNGAGEGHEIMISLSELLYAFGKIVEPDKILVELGDGFFLEKSTKDALKVLARKRKAIDANSENVLAVAEACSQSAQAVHQAMQGKMMEIKARQQRRMVYINQMEKKTLKSFVSDHTQC
jgi:prefoldin alpha subunit